MAAVASECSALVQGAQFGGVAMRLHYVDAFTAAHPVRAADDVRQVDRVVVQFG